MATTVKLNIDKATVLQLFKAVVTATDENREQWDIVHSWKNQASIESAFNGARVWVLHAEFIQRPDWGEQEGSPRHKYVVRHRTGEQQARMVIPGSCEQQSVIGGSLLPHAQCISGISDNGRGRDWCRFQRVSSIVPIFYQVSTSCSLWSSIQDQWGTQ